MGTYLSFSNRKASWPDSVSMMLEVGTDFSRDASEETETGNSSCHDTLNGMSSR